MESGGGGGDAFASSTAPLTWHDFLERMRHPSAADFVKSIKSFIVTFSNKAPDPEKDSAAVQEFLANMEGAFRAHTLWAGSSEEELESAGEGLEKYVMTKLYNRAFASLPEDVKHDEELFEKIALVQKFIRPENLDIKPMYQNETSWLLAQKELQKINMYKAPRDKLVCILSCCKVINNLLLNASISSSDNPPGADEFLPVLIYVTIKANPPQLHSNLLYIQRYRSQSRLVSEAAYFFTNILSAESFISNIDAQSLSMDEAEFQRNMESAKAILLGLASDSESHGNQINEQAMEQTVEQTKTTSNVNDYVKEKDVARDTKDQPISKSQSITNLERQGASDLLKEEQLSKYFLEYPFLYANAGDLTTEDVEDLLNSYKQLVLKYVSLSKGMGMNIVPNPAPSIQTEAKTESSEESRDQVEVMPKERLEGLTSYRSNDSLFASVEESESKVQDDESKMPADDSVSYSVTEKDNTFQ